MNKGQFEITLNELITTPSLLISLLQADKYAAILYVAINS